MWLISETGAFLKALATLAGRSDLFFWAGGITFNVLVAVVPLLLLVVGLAGFFLSARFGQPATDLLDVLVSYLPVVEGDVQLTEAVRQLLNGLVEERAPLSLIGGFILLWISTRLVASLRIVLGQVFELDSDRGPVRGKLFDLFVVFLGGGFLAVNVGLTFALGALQALGVELFGVSGGTAIGVQTFLGRALSFGSAWVLFFLLYWYLPARRIPFRSSAVGATFTSIVYELMKGGFAWYVTSLASYSSLYGSMGAVVILFFWTYYSAVVFILGGQVARVHEVRRSERMGRPADAPDGRGGVGAGLGGALLITVTLCLPFSAIAQSVAPFGGNGNIAGFLNGSEGVVLAASSLERDLTLDRPLVNTEGPYVVVHIAESRVLLLEGTEVVWSAPAGTGHGFQLEGRGRSWTFTTPVGMFRVLRREKDPIWIAPDWYYIEQNLPIPPAAQRARVAGTLGTSALFLGDGIAIHGTNRPDLLLDPDPDARRVSHGCIRLTNEAARELYHRVEVGTPVLIF